MTLRWWPHLGPQLERHRKRPRDGSVHAGGASADEAAVGAGAAPAQANVTQRSLGAIEDRILQLERQLAEIGDEGSDDGGDAGEAASSATAVKRKKLRDQPGDASGLQACHRSRSSAPAAPLDPAALRCEVCGISVNSLALMQEHLKGRKHRDAARMQQAAAEGRFCETCGIVFTGAAQYKEHCQGKQHRSKLAAHGKGRGGGGRGRGGGGSRGTAR